MVGAQRISKAVGNILYDTVMLDICHYTFDEIHNIQHQE